MQADRSSAARRAPLRARIGARLRSERGDTLIEVIIGALMVALIATASLGGFADIGHLSQTQRSEEQAAALAQQDQARLRGLTIAQLSANGTGTGNTSSTQQVNGTIYTVTSASQFISGSTGTAACNGGGADEVQTTSTVTWGAGNTNTGRRPVIVHGVITPNIGGAIVASIDTLAGMVAGTTGQGATGASITLTGPTAVTPVVVDSSGCAVFSGLASGTYTVKYTMPAGSWIYYPSGTSTVPNQSTVVTNTRASTVQPQYIAQAGAVRATFKTTYNNAAVTTGSDTFELANSQLATQLVGTDSTKTNNTFAATLTSPTNVFPFDPAEPANYQYSAYAGGCTANVPTGANAPAAFTVSPGATTSVQIPEPPLVILPYSGTPHATVINTPTTIDDRNAALVRTGANWSNVSLAGDLSGTESDDSTSGQSVKIVLPLGTTTVSLIAKTGTNEGKATVTLSPAVTGTPANVDLYTTTTKLQQPFVINGTLNPATTYTLTFTESNTKNASSSGFLIAIDGISYSVQSAGTPTYTQGPLLTTKPTVTLTDSGCSNNEDWPPTVANPSTAPYGALQYPGVPWTSGTYSVCVDDGTNNYTQNWTPSWAGTTALNQITALIYPGATAPASGAGFGTGTCP